MFFYLDGGSSLKIMGGLTLSPTVNIRKYLYSKKTWKNLHVWILNWNIPRSVAVMIYDLKKCMHIVFAILSLLIPICFQCLWSTSHIMFLVIKVNCYTCICFNATFRKKMHSVSWQTCYKTFTYIFISKGYFYVWPDTKSCKIKKK